MLTANRSASARADIPCSRCNETSSSGEGKLLFGDLSTTGSIDSGGFHTLISSSLILCHVASAGKLVLVSSGMVPFRCTLAVAKACAIWPTGVKSSWSRFVDGFSTVRIESSRGCSIDS